MPVHLLRDVGLLKKDILTLGTMAELAVQEATAAIEARDAARAQRVIDNDIKLDEMEVQVEESCLKILALYQPVATDLRFIVAVLKINNDLERVGDLAVNVAERAAFLATRPPVDISFDFDAMARKAQAMLQKSLDSLVNLNAELAHEVCAADDEVDELNRQMYRIVKDMIPAQPQHTESLIHMFSATRHLERIADHATNIAEDVIYMIEGRIIRHRL